MATPDFISDAEMEALQPRSAAAPGVPDFISDEEMERLQEPYVSQAAQQFGSGVVEGNLGFMGVLADIASAVNPATMGRGNVLQNSQNVQQLSKDYLAAPSNQPDMEGIRTVGNFVGPSLTARAGTKIFGNVVSPFLQRLGSNRGIAESLGGAFGDELGETIAPGSTIVPLVTSTIGGGLTSVAADTAKTVRSALVGATKDEIQGSAAHALKEATGLRADDIKAAIERTPNDKFGRLMTLAEVTDNAGAAQLEKTIAASDDSARLYAQRAADRNAVRDEALDLMTTSGGVNREGLGTRLMERGAAVQDDMQRNAQELWSQVPRNAEIDATGVQGEISSILRSRQGGLDPRGKVQNLVDQLFVADEGGLVKRDLTSGALQDIRSDALMLMRETELTGHEQRLLTALQSGIDDSMSRSLTGEAYDAWVRARDATRETAETFSRSTAGGSLVADNARPSNVLANALKGDSQSIRELRAAVKNDPSVMEDVKRGILDRVPRNAQDELTPAKMKQFISGNEGGIRELFGEEHLQTMNRILEDMQSQARVERSANLASAGNSATAQKQTVAAGLEAMFSDQLLPGPPWIARLAQTIKEGAGLRDKALLKQALFAALLDPAQALELAETPNLPRMLNAVDKLKAATVNIGRASATAAAEEVNRNLFTQEPGQQTTQDPTTLGSYKKGSEAKSAMQNAHRSDRRNYAPLFSSSLVGPRTAPEPTPQTDGLRPGGVSTKTYKTQPLFAGSMKLTKPQITQVIDPIVPEEDRALVKALIHQESRGKTNAVSPKGAQGLMQLMPQIQKAFGISDPFDPIENVRGGYALLREERERFKSLPLAIAAYNAGSPKVTKAIKKAGSRDIGEVLPHLPAETQKYVQDIMKALA